MKKLSILFMAVLVAALAGCAGDTAGEGGTLVTVQSLELDGTSAGTNIVLVWSAVTEDIDGYEVYFKADGAGDWTILGESTTTTYTDVATNAGTYSVRAFKDEDFSENFATAVTTMPNVISGTYTIVDNNAAPATLPSGFRFGSSAGETGSASSPSFEQDIYAYDDDFKGDSNVSLYSGNKGSFGNGIQSYFQVPLGNGYCNPSGTWYNTSYELLSGDSVVFVALTDGNNNINGYAKMHGLTITPNAASEHGTELTFSYEIQVAQQGAGILTVFTSNAN